MTHFDMHDAIDRLDTGLADQPHLDAIVAGGRKRRRRTRTLWTAAGLATVASVAQLAFLAGTHQASGTASATEAASAAVPSADFTSQVDQAVSTAVSGSAPDDPRPIGYWQSYEVDGVRLIVRTGGGLQLNRNDFPSQCKAGDDCRQTQVGNLLVSVRDDVSYAGTWVREVTVTSATLLEETSKEDLDRRIFTSVSAATDARSQAEAGAALPSVETLTELAIDLEHLSHE